MKQTEHNWKPTSLVHVIMSHIHHSAIDVYVQAHEQSTLTHLYVQCFFYLIITSKSRRFSASLMLLAAGILHLFVKTQRFPHQSQ